MQDVFVAVLRAEETLRDEAPSALLLRIATNVCLNRLADELVLSIADAGSGDGHPPDAESRTLARNLLAKLFRPDDPLAASTETIAVMHLVDGLTLEEVAREAGLSVSGVRKRLRTLRGRLSQLEGV